MTRREFIFTVAAAGLVPPILGANKAGVRIAAQMFSLRDIIWMDEHGFLAMIGLMKKFGYDGVEFAGVKVDPKELKKYMDDIGIVCASAHEGLADCLKDKIAETCEKNLDYGNRNLVMPWAPVPEDCKDKVGWLKKLGADLSDGAAVAKRYGCHLAYHNHGHEFTEKIGGVSYWDIIMSDATSDLEVQFDLGHLVRAGEDPKKWFARYPKSVRTVHAKNICVPDAKLRLANGEAGIDWPEIFDLTERNITEWYIVEAESNPADTQKMKYGVDFLRRYL